MTPIFQTLHQRHLAVEFLHLDGLDGTLKLEVLEMLEDSAANQMESKQLDLLQKMRMSMM
jgi:hypothetical protein